MKSVGVVGSIVIDTIVSTLREIPFPGGKISTFIDSIITRPGGGAANMGQNLALLDIPVQLFAKIGTDTEGDYLLKTFSETGIDTRFVKRDPILPTSHTIVCVHSGGERTFLCCTPICASFGIKDIDKDALFSHPYLFYQDFFSFPELDTGSVIDLLKEAKEHNIVTFLDECQGYLGVKRDIWENILPYIDYLLPSAADLTLIYPGKTPEELCHVFHTLGAKNIIIKQGKKNTVFFDGISIQEMSPLNGKVIDTTGAGDAFDSGFTWGILNNLSLQDSISTGHIVAAECIANLGASIPRNRQTELLEVLQTNNLK
jgi:sugar/nucleoside kinase (ribokinase family)